jgi:hypothetical protein
MNSDKKLVFTSSKNNDPSRKKLADQIGDFLQLGGEIQQIPNGISAQRTLDEQRQISLLKRPIPKKK